MMQGKRMIDILVVEHPPAVRRTLCARLALEPDMSVVGEADDEASAVRLARALQPRIILLDAEMPNLDLCGTVQAIRSVVAASLVILTLHTAIATQALALEEATVVGKYEGTPALLTSIRRAAEQDA
jgi:DNA-binding NarL/FixJ family response regulator